MSAVDTSAEAVERLRSAFRVLIDKHEPGAVERELFTTTMEKLSALAAQRDALKRLNAEYEDHIRSTEADRDRLAAENARLREALTVCVTAHETGQYEPARIAYEEAKIVLGMEPRHD